MKKQILTVIISMIATISLVGFTTNYIIPKVQPVTELESRPIQPIEIKLEPISIEINETVNVSLNLTTNISEELNISVNETVNVTPEINETTEINITENITEEVNETIIPFTLIVIFIFHICK